MKIEIKVGSELFQFGSFRNWCDTAKRKFKRAKVDQYTAICLDADGRICTCGEQFIRADKEGKFPVTVYAISEF